MKCEHGNEVKVQLEMISSYWDDGLNFYDAIGTRTLPGDSERDFLRVEGCPTCKLVECETDMPTADF